MPERSRESLLREQARLGLAGDRFALARFYEDGEFTSVQDAAEFVRTQVKASKLTIRDFDAISDAAWAVREGQELGAALDEPLVTDQEG